jgi:phosphoglycerol transferase
VRRLAPYVATAIASTICGAFLLDLGKADLRVPIDYGGDSLLFSLIVKSVVDHGWYWTNPNVGAPEGLVFHDFAVSAHDTVHLLLIKLMALPLHDWALVLNLYFILGFPMIALSAMAVFRHFRVDARAAIIGSILYSCLPSRLLKGEGHLFLDTFFQVPLAVMMILWVTGEDPPLMRERGESRWPSVELRRRRSIAALALSALIASTSAYYAYFTVCLLVPAGAWASFARRSLCNALSGVALAGAVVVGLAANGLPTTIYHATHGANHEVGERGSWEAELYGLKISNLLLPVPGHRLAPLRELKARYERKEPLRGEGSGTSLGAVGAIGFLVLLGSVVAGRQSEKARATLLRPLGILTLLALLLGTVGGFGSLIALVISPQIRTYARLNVFLAFFSLFAVVLLLERLLERRPGPASWLLPGVLLLGLLDQGSVFATRPYEATKSAFASDEEIVRRIEASVPGAAIFQLPYMAFPETPAVHEMQPYDPIRPYLHSRTLRWSYPAMRGRPADRWLRAVSDLPAARLLAAVSANGFAGVLIDRAGYEDRATAVEASLRTALGAPLVSENGRLAFYSLAGYRPPPQAQGPPGSIDCGNGTCGTSDCGLLASGKSLSAGESIVSCDGRFSLTIEDGELALGGAGCAEKGGSCWRSGSAGHAGAHAVMQEDGNLVVYGPGCRGANGSCWDSGSAGHGGASLAVQNDGKVCVLGPTCRGPEGPCWCSP